MSATLAQCRGASVQAVSSKLVCLALNRDRFSEVLGKHHLEEIMAREKSAAVVTTRLMRLQVRPPGALDLGFRI